LNPLDCGLCIVGYVLWVTYSARMNRTFDVVQKRNGEICT